MIQITPQNPTDREPVGLTVLWMGCITDSGIERVGTTFNIYYIYSADCFTTPPSATQTFKVGALPAGHYTVNYTETVEGAPPSRESLTFQVVGGAAQIFSAPTLGVSGLVFLAIALAYAVFRVKPYGT